MYKYRSSLLIVIIIIRPIIIIIIIIIKYSHLFYTAIIFNTLKVLCCLYVQLDQLLYVCVEQSTHVHSILV